MLITRVELENIKSYKHVVVDFRRGTTAISGANGAGKTTLVEAIGYALFNHLPYKQDQFVREGEKYGRVIVHLIGGDDRPYIVERRCGSGARWFMTDTEADVRLEQGADMQDRLHDLFGIDRERPLDSLFKDALGVPQGTFTAIFLETASKRKQTFDALLQIEDYKTAADYLLEAQHHYKEQAAEQRSKIGRLEYETRELEGWRITLAEARQRDEQQKQQNLEWSQQLSLNVERLTILNEQKRQLEVLQQRYETSQATYTNAQNLLTRDEQLLHAARTAQEIVEASRADSQRYQQAEKTLTRLRKDEQQRNKLRVQQGELNTTRVMVETNQRNLQKRLEEVAAAQQQIEALAPLVEQQVELEQRRDDLKDKVSRHNAIMGEGKRLKDALAGYTQKHEALQQSILTIEPLEAAAGRFHEWNETLHQLEMRESERRGKQQKLQEKRDELRNKQIERDSIAEKLRKAEGNISTIEEHRQEAEEKPTLEAKRTTLIAQQNRLEGNIEGYAKSRAQSAGGQCPLLHETCLNIKGRGIVSLESYFDGLLTEEHARLAVVQQEQEAVIKREQQIEKYVEWLSKLGQWTDRRDSQAEQLQRIAIDITKLERDTASLAQDLDDLKLVEQQIGEAKKAYAESKDADLKVRELPGLYKQVKQFEEQIQKGEADLDNLRQEIAGLKGSEALLKQVEADIAALNDPRSQSRAQQAVVEKAGYFEQQLQGEQQRWQETQQQLQVLAEQLSIFAALDDDINQQEAIRLSSYEGYQNYLKNEETARLLPERERTYQQQLNATEQAAQRLQAAEQSYNEAKAAFNQDELTAVGGEITRLRDSLSALSTEILHNQEKINKLEDQITQAEALLVELEAAQKEQQTLEDLHAMMLQFRGYIKEAAPHVLKAMLGDISAEANRVFGEIMGDRSAQLSWQNDYEIILRRQGVNRTFAQLSGGEQMSAALSIRLALLKKLSTLNIAFFDEPTQNMDELRRMNLAEQIRRVRGFDQLIVISHDDTFEQGLDSIVRLSKVEGETRQLEDDEVRREQVHSYAS